TAYEQLAFCELFHQVDTGWRDCTSCGKRLHCGCIDSSAFIELLNNGGVRCVGCISNSRPEPSTSDDKPKECGVSIEITELSALAPSSSSSQKPGFIPIDDSSNATIVPLFEKVLSASDAANRIGRLVLPKSCTKMPTGMQTRITSQGLNQRKKRSRNIGSKSKRLLIESQDALDLKYTWEELQDMLFSPTQPSTVTINDQEFEEYEEPPVFGKGSVFTVYLSGEQDQWAQCDNCSKWRRLPVDFFLPSKWTCQENLWDHSICLIGKGGSIISDMGRISKANIRIISKDDLPKVAEDDDEMVQVGFYCLK
ncbi:B3 domain-containing transcription repressor VAL2-like protein isoform X2, partial [Tanacetum coccineum]